MSIFSIKEGNLTRERGRRQECRAALPASENLGVRGTVTRRGLATW